MTKREKVDLSRRILDTAADALLPRGGAERRRRPHRGRVGRREDDALLPLPVEGRARRRMASSPRRRMDELARRRGRAPSRQPAPRRVRGAARVVRDADVPRLRLRQRVRRARLEQLGRGGDRRLAQADSSASTWQTLRGRRAPPEPDADTLARELLLLVDGAIVTASIQGDSRVADAARGAAAKVIAGYTLAPDASATL